MYYTYILRCEDNSLYTGITTSLERRMKEHAARGKKCASYTRSHKYKTIETAFQSDSREAAGRLEYLVKKLDKARKEKLVKSPGLIAEYFADEGEEWQIVDVSHIANAQDKTQSD